MIFNKEKYDIPEAARKFHYWRGFAVAMFLSAIGFIAFCHAVIKIAQ